MGNFLNARFFQFQPTPLPDGKGDVRVPNGFTIADVFQPTPLPDGKGDLVSV